MFAIGEHVIHPGQGVCTVMGFEETPAPMIVLEAKSGHAKTRMMYPMAQQDRLHACISREVAQDLIENYDAIECDPFTERNSSLEESYFKKQLKQGAPETVRVAKTMRHRIHVAQSHDKKPSSYIIRACSKRPIAEPSRSSRSRWDAARKSSTPISRRPSRTRRLRPTDSAPAAARPAAPRWRIRRHAVCEPRTLRSILRSRFPRFPIDSTKEGGRTSCPAPFRAR